MTVQRTFDESQVHFQWKFNKLNFDFPDSEGPKEKTHRLENSLSGGKKHILTHWIRQCKMKAFKMGNEMVLFPLVGSDPWR